MFPWIVDHNLCSFPQLSCYGCTPTYSMAFESNCRMICQMITSSNLIYSSLEHLLLILFVIELICPHKLINYYLIQIVQLIANVSSLSSETKSSGTVCDRFLSFILLSRFFTSFLSFCVARFGFVLIYFSTLKKISLQRKI